MSRSTHRTYASWIFGIVLLGFMMAVFWLAPDQLPLFKQQTLAFSAALLAGFFGFFLTGSLSLAMQHKESSTTLNAAGGIALFIVVLAWWNSAYAPVVTAETQTNKVQTSSDMQNNSSMNVDGDANIKTTEQASTIIKTGNGQIQQGQKLNGEVKETKASSGNSSINIGGSLSIESSDESKTIIDSGNGQIQQAE